MSLYSTPFSYAHDYDSTLFLLLPRVLSVATIMKEKVLYKCFDFYHYLKILIMWKGIWTRDQDKQYIFYYITTSFINILHFWFFYIFSITQHNGFLNKFGVMQGVTQDDNIIYICLFVWVYGISTFVGYLMPNPFYTISSSISNNSV